MSFLVAFTLLATLVSAQNDFDFEYVVVIEAQEEATFGSCYRFNRRDTVGEPIVDLTLLGETQSVQPLHYFAAVGQLSTAQAQMQQLIAYCQDRIPKKSLEYTPAFALLGGGVRALSAPLQRNLVTVVHQTLMLSCFRVGSESENAIVLDPTLEATYGFAAARVLRAAGPIGVLTANLKDAALVREPTASAPATGSAQLLDGTQVPVAAVEATFEFSRTTLVTMLRTLPDGSARQQDWPCFPRDYTATFNVVTPRGQPRTYDVRGTADPDACEAAISDAIARTRADGGAQPIVIEDVTELLALGGLEATLREIDAGSSVLLETLVAGARDECARDWTAVRAAAASTPNAALAARCERALWTALVVRDVFSLPAGVRLLLESNTRVERVSATRGFVEDRAPTLPIGAPPRGVRCEELVVNIDGLEELPRVIAYQCDCVTFRHTGTLSGSGQPSGSFAAHHISSDELLRQVMPSFSTAFLFPPRAVAEYPDEYPRSEYRVCTDTTTTPGAYNYHCDVMEDHGMTGDFIVRPQRMFGEE